jgi:hypothetical protein
MKKWIALVLGFLLVLCTAAFADVAPIPDGDIGQVIVQLLTNWKSLSPLALGMAAVVISAQIIKAYVGDGFKYKRLLNLFLACLYGIGLAIQSGMGWLPALVSILVTGGGAAALYEALKGVGILKSGSAPVPPSA